MILDDDYRLVGRCGTLAIDGNNAHDANRPLLTPRHEAVSRFGGHREPASEELARGVPETVLLPEERLRVPDTRQFPFSAICGLHLVAETGHVFRGTGFLVGERLVLTAGHNVFKHDYRGFMRYIYVYPGLNGDFQSPPFGWVRTRLFHTVAAWTSDQDPEMDIGAIVLPTPLGRQAGWFSVTRLTDGSLAGLAVTSSGYPVQCPSSDAQQCGLPGSTQWYHKDNIQAVESYRLLYSIDTSEGSSGAPIFAYYPDKSDKYQVVGIHNYGYSAYNSGTRINRPVFDKIVKWLKASEASGA